MATGVKGIDGYNGDMFKQFTRGDTLPFKFSFVDSSNNNTPIDVTGWKIYITFSDKLSCEASTNSIEAVIEPTINPTDGILEGYVEDSMTFSLIAGTVYGSVRVIKDDNRTYILDKAKIKLGECVTGRRDQ